MTRYHANVYQIFTKSVVTSCVYLEDLNIKAVYHFEILVSGRIYGVTFQKLTQPALIALWKPQSLMYQLVILVPFETNRLTCTAQAPPDICFVGTQSFWHQCFEVRWVIVTLLVNNTTGINWVGAGANAPQYIAYLRIVFWLLSWNWGDRRGKGCVFIKDWFKPIFPLFLTWLLPKVSNIYGRFLKLTLERIWKETVEPDFVYCPRICLEENCVNLIQGSQFPQPGFEPIILQL